MDSLEIRWDTIEEIERDRLVIRLTERLKEIEVYSQDIGWDRTGQIKSDKRMITLTERSKSETKRPRYRLEEKHRK